MYWLVIYDIRDARRLARIAKLMEQYGVRVQKSVFECMCEKAVIEKMRQQAKEILEKEDSLISISLCDVCWQKKMQYGVREAGAGEMQPYRIL